MKRILIIPLLLLISSCTRSVDIPSEMHGVLLHLGEIQNSASGPTTINKTFFVDHIVLINKEYSVLFNNGQYVVRYEVLDPEKYYRVVHGNGTIHDVVLEALAKQSLSGKSINSEAELRALIESMELPIKVLNNA